MSPASRLSSLGPTIRVRSGAGGESPIPRFVLANEVDAECSCRLLAAHIREADIENIVQHIDVLFEPGREVVRLVLPNLAKGDLSILPIDGMWGSGVAT